MQWNNVWAMGLIVATFSSCGQTDDLLNDNSAIKDQRISELDWHDSRFKKINDKEFSDKAVLLMDKASASKTTWSVDIRALAPNGDKYIVYRYGGNNLVRPASTMKLFTAWAYFHAFPSPTAESMDKLKYVLQNSKNTGAQELLDEAAQEFAGEGEPIENGYRAIRKLFYDHNIQKLLVGPQTDGNHHVIGDFDGSGLTYKSQITATDLVRQVWTVYQGEFRQKFFDILPEGNKTGTLKDVSAFEPSSCGGAVFAKTGTLLDTPLKALAGYVKVPNGFIINFAIIADNPEDVYKADSSIQDLVCQAAKKVSSL